MPKVIYAFCASIFQLKKIGMLNVSKVLVHY